MPVLRTPLRVSLWEMQLEITLNEKMYTDYNHYKICCSNPSGSNPIIAVHLGYHDYEEAIEDRSVAGIQEIIRNCQHFFDRVEEVLDRSRNELSFQDKFHLRLLKREVQFCLKWKDHKGYLFAQVDFLDGLQKSLPMLFGSEDILRLVRSTHPHGTPRSL